MTMNKLLEKQRLAVLAPSLGGGIGRVIVNLVDGFIQKGIAVDILVAKQEGPYIDLLPPSARIIKLPTTHMVSGVPFLAHYLRQARPYAVLTESVRSNALVLRTRRFSGVPTKIFAGIHNTYSMALESRDPDKKIRLLKRMKKYLPLNDGIIAVSRGVAEDLICLLDLPRERVKVIYNPVINDDIDYLAQQKPGHSWFEKTSPPIILSAGRLHPQKDFPTLLKAFALVSKDKPCRLMILGEGEERNKLEALVCELQLQGRVVFPGQVANPYAYMAQSRLFVLSSAWEGFGNVLAEALAVGTPVVSTDCPSGPREILQNGLYGALVPVGNVQALSQAIRDTLEQKTDSEFLKKSVQPFQVQTVIDQYLNYLGFSFV